MASARGAGCSAEATFLEAREQVSSRLLQPGRFRCPPDLGNVLLDTRGRRGRDDPVELLGTQVAEEVECLGPQTGLSGGADDAGEPFMRQHRDDVVEAVLVLDHERDLQ